MPWSESQRCRLALERTILEKYFKDDVKWLEPTGETTVELTLRSNSDTDYKLRVYLPNDFPNSCPHMAVVFPVQLMMKNGRSLPLLDDRFHTLGLTVDGFTKLCHHSPELWTADNTLFQVFMKGRLWIEAYEGHLETGDTMEVYLRHQSQTSGDESRSCSGVQPEIIVPSKETDARCTIS